MSAAFAPVSLEQIRAPRLIRAATALAAAAGLGLTSAACGGAGSRSSDTHATVATGNRRSLSQRAPGLTYRTLYLLPSPVRDPAFASLGGGRFVLLGGLDGAGSSTDGIELADLHSVLHTAALPLAQHDAQGALLGHTVYVFGGGSFSELDHIISFNPADGSVGSVGSLPRSQSDVAVTAGNGSAYIVGGYDGTNWLDTIISWRPGAGARVIAHLPVGLRYAATSYVNGQILIIGGSTPNGASDAVYRFDPATGKLQTIGHLPRPITHAAAATLGSYVYLVGGRGDDLTSQSAEIWSIDPRTGSVRPAGRLPQPLSDVAAVTLDHVLVVAGGLSRDGSEAAVGELAPKPISAQRR